MASFVISRAFATLSTEFVRSVIEEAGLGVIKRIDRVEIDDKFAKFFIHMESWNDYGLTFQSRLQEIADLQASNKTKGIKDKVDGIKIYYDEDRPKPYFWIIYLAKTDEDRQKEKDARLKAPRIRIVL